MTTSAEWSWERADDFFPTRLRFLRESFGLSAKAAAMACGLDDQAWRNWESRLNGTSQDTIAKIAARFESRPDKATLLAGWLILGGPLPERPQPAAPFVSPVKTTPAEPLPAGKGSRIGRSRTCAGQQSVFVQAVGF